MTTFFDTHFPSEVTKNKGLFKKFTKNEEFALDHFQTIFSCYIKYWKENGVRVAAFIKIIDAKFIIFKVFYFIVLFFNNERC